MNSRLTIFSGGLVQGIFGVFLYFLSTQSFGQILDERTSKIKSTIPQYCPYGGVILDEKPRKIPPPLQKYETWEVDVSVPHALSFVYTSKGLVLALVDKRVILLDKHGHVVWTHRVQGGLRLGLGYDERFLYYGDVKGTIVALNLSDGSVVWESSGFGQLAFKSQFHLSKDCLVFVYDTNNVAAISKQDGSSLWNKVLDTNRFFRPVGDDEFTFLVSGEKVYKLSSQTGDILSTKGCKPLIADPLFYDEKLFLFRSNEILVFDASNNLSKVNWQQDVSIASQPQVYDESLYVVNRNAELMKIDTDSGEILWKRKVSEGAFVTEYITDDVLLVARVEGKLLKCFNTEYGDPVRILHTDRGDANILGPVLRTFGDFISYISASWKVYKAHPFPRVKRFTDT